MVLAVRSRDLNPAVTIPLSAGEPVVLGRAHPLLYPVISDAVVSRRQCELAIDDGTSPGARAGSDPAQRVILTALGKNPVCVIRKGSHTMKMVHKDAQAVLHTGDCIYLAHSGEWGSGVQPFLIVNTQPARGSGAPPRAAANGAGGAGQLGPAETVALESPAKPSARVEQRSGAASAGRKRTRGEAASSAPSSGSSPPPRPVPDTSSLASTAAAEGDGAASSQASASPSKKARKAPGAQGQDTKPWAKLVSMNPGFESIELCKEMVIVGRGKNKADAVVNHGNVSGRHVRIWREEVARGPDDGAGGVGHVVKVEDLKSTNGTWVESKRIEPHMPTVLRHGGELTVSMQTASSKDAPGGGERLSYFLTDYEAEAAESRARTAALEGTPAEKYIIRHPLGQGAFAVVYLVVDRGTGKKYAMKVIDKKRAAKSGTSEAANVAKEVELMQSLDHPHIVRVREFFDEDDKLSVVMDLRSGGDLCDKIILSGAYPEETAREIARQLAGAVSYLHSRGVVHRDLKPENVLLDGGACGDGEAANPSAGAPTCFITDFGISKLAGDGFMTTICGTPAYLSPEVLQMQAGELDGGKYSSLVDVWSLGAIIYVMLAGAQPFNPSSTASLLRDIGKPLTFKGSSAHCSSEAKDLIRQMLNPDPSKRISIADVLKHPWILPREQAVLLDESF